MPRRSDPRYGVGKWPNQKGVVEELVVAAFLLGLLAGIVLVLLAR